MRIARAPLRVSLFGGGSDLPAYYSLHGGLVISFALNRHIYVTWNDRPTGGCRLSYSEVEELDTLRDARHGLVRAASKQWAIPEPCTMTIVSDVPKGTGLGSSSALTIALARLFSCTRYLPEMSFKLEHSVNDKVGLQDFLPAYHGGFRSYSISKEGLYFPSEHNAYLTSIIESHGVLLYTGITRQAAPLLRTWSERESTIGELHDLAKDVQLLHRPTAETLGDLLDETWSIKCSIEGVCTYDLYEQYKLARKAGALGGKLCGAGAGGCWFFLVPPDIRERFISRMRLIEIPFSVSEAGVQTWTLE